VSFTPRSKCRFPIFFLLIFGCIFSFAVVAATIQEIDENEDGKADQWIEIIDAVTTKVTKDRDFDGTPDYELLYDDQARKISETIDFNFDGAMDDFYYYENGVLVRRELDTDYNKTVDLWVFLVKGIYIGRIERDTDDDGEIDFVRDYEIDTDG
jgi:hypothetical protein